MAVLQVKGRDLVPGLEVSIIGERGRFRFQYATWSKGAEEWVLTFIGGTAGHECWRSFYLRQVKKVYK